MFPDTWTWAALQAESGAFLANPMVTGALLFGLSVILGPMGVIAIKRAIRRG